MEMLLILATYTLSTVLGILIYQGFAKMRKAKKDKNNKKECDVD